MSFNNTSPLLLPVEVPGTSTGSNSGDVLLNDTDVDADDTLIVVGTVAQSGGTNTAGASVASNSETADVGAKIDGIYGDLTLNEDGSYSYIANDAESLNNGETVTDIFTFTTSDTQGGTCLLYTSPSPRDRQKSRMPSSA